MTAAKLTARRLAVALAALAALTVSPTATAATRVAVAETPAPQFYRLQAHFLDGLPEPAKVVFVYLNEDREIARDEIVVPWTDREYVLLPIPHAGLNLWRTAELARPLMEVWLGDTLMDELDREGFDAYQFRLHIRHGDELRPTTDARRARPGGPEAIQCNSPCGGGCTPSGDYDCDGVANYADNCIDFHNPNQADCDNDGAGDACDIVPPWVNANPVTTCMVDLDEHFILNDRLEHHVEVRQTDPSSCGYPDRWVTWIKTAVSCGSDEIECCRSKLKTSLESVGDTIWNWCTTSKISQDYCH